jgi:trk system potassium uptake protein
LLYKSNIKHIYLLIFKYLGTVLIGNAVILFIPLILLIFYPDETEYALGFLLPGVSCLILGLLIYKFTKTKSGVVLSFQEGGILVLLSWLITIILCSLPFKIILNVSWAFAIFESTSGVTTTGLSVFTPEDLPKMILLFRSLLQFIGGIGIAAVMISAIIGPQGMGLSLAEGRSDKLLPNVARSTKMILIIYFSFAISAVILYRIAGMNWFDAINHSMTVVSTGGFSTKNDSIASFNSQSIELITLMFMILGAINFAAIFLLFNGKVRRFVNIGENRLLFGLFALLTPIGIFFTLNKPYSSLSESIRYAKFEHVSAITTTGFSIVNDYHAWHDLSLFTLVLLMIIGGGYGSTSGGIKVYRIYVLLKSMIWGFKDYFLPKNAVRENYLIRPDGKFYVSDNHVKDVSNYIFLYFFFFTIYSIIFMAFGFETRVAFFEAATTLSGVGLTYLYPAELNPILLWLMSFGMLLGRLEFIVVFVAIIKVVRDFRISISD